MTNYYLNYKNQILTIAKRTDIDGLGGKKPTLDIACDIFDQNAITAVTGKGDFVECGVPKTDKEFWQKAYDERTKVATVRELRVLQHEFATDHIKRINITIGSRKASVNGKTKTLDVAPRAENGVTLVPIRFVAEALGCEVEYNAKTKEITITK